MQLLRQAVSVVAMLAATPASVVAAQAAPVVQLKLHHMLGPLAPGHRAMLVPWADKVTRQSNGRIQITIFTSMQLGGQAPALIDQVRDGIVDLAWTLPTYTPGRFPRVEVFELPFLNASPIVMNLALAEFVANHPEEFAEYKLISVFVHAGMSIHSKKPVRTADDLQGLKIRIPGRTTAWMVDAMGSTPIGAPISKIPEMLSKGDRRCRPDPVRSVGASQSARARRLPHPPG